MTSRLRDLHAGARLGLSALLLALLLGLATSAAHLVGHYQNRDEIPGLTLDDIRAAYRGINAPAPLLASLQRGHPDTLSPESRAMLQRWLASARVSEDFDSLDLGDASPSEILAASCVSCHARSAPDAKARALPLESWEDVKRLAFPRRVDPNPMRVIIASAHAHALAMGTMGLALALLAAATRWPRALSGALAAIMGVGLFADVGSWFLARHHHAFVHVIVAAGFAFNVAVALLIALILLDLWRPRPRASAS